MGLSVLLDIQESLWSVAERFGGVLMGAYWRGTKDGRAGGEGSGGGSGSGSILCLWGDASVPLISERARLKQQLHRGVSVCTVPIV